MTNKEKNIKDLEKIGYTSKEIKKFCWKCREKLKEKDSVEELKILLGSIEIYDLKDFLSLNKHILGRRIDEIAEVITKSIKKTKDIGTTRLELMMEKFY